MYLQRLEDAQSSPTNWPTDCVEKPDQLMRMYEEADATLNSWSLAHQYFQLLQGDKERPVAAAHRRFEQLVSQALRANWGRPSHYGTEIVAHAVLKTWIDNRQSELKMQPLPVLQGAAFSDHLDQFRLHPGAVSYLLEYDPKDHSGGVPRTAYIWATNLATARAIAAQMAKEFGLEVLSVGLRK